MENQNLINDTIAFVKKELEKMSRSYQDELNYLERINEYSWRIKKGFVPNMRVRATEKINV